VLATNKINPILRAFMTTIQTNIINKLQPAIGLLNVIIVVVLIIPLSPGVF